MLRPAEPGRPAWSTARLTALGAAGATVIALSSWWVGAIPNSFQSHPPAAVAWLRVGSIPPRSAFYVGLGMLGLAWLILAREVLLGTRTMDRRAVVTLVLAWALPVMAAMPLGSRDLWAYAAQGNLIRHGLDAYVASPADLAGAFRDNVSPRWVHATDPYGPLWLMVGRAIAVVCGDHVVVTVFVTRLTTLAGLLAALAGLLRICARLGRRADRAVVLALANPLTLVLGLGGGHNDLLMTGLMVLGVAVVLGSGGIWTTLGGAAALMAVAAAIKSPAAIGVAFTVPLWLARRERARRSALPTVAAACGVAVLGAGAAFTAVSLISGYGVGWVKQVSASAPVVNWMSLPSAAAMVFKIASGSVRGATKLDPTMEHFRSAGLVLAAVVLVLLWCAAIASAGTWTASAGLVGRARRFSPMAYLAIALTVIVLLGPSVQPWYFGWALPFVALVNRPRGVDGFLLGASIGLVAMIAPSGRGVQMSPQILIVIAVSAAIGWWVVRTASVPGDDDADRARAGVRADRGPDL